MAHFGYYYHTWYDQPYIGIVSLIGVVICWILIFMLLCRSYYYLYVYPDILNTELVLSSQFRNIVGSPTSDHDSSKTLTSVGNSQIIPKLTQSGSNRVLLELASQESSETKTHLLQKLAEFRTLTKIKWHTKTLVIASQAFAFIQISLILSVIVVVLFFDLRKHFPCPLRVMMCVSFYSLQRGVLYLFFLLRLYFAFKGTMFAININVIRLFIVSAMMVIISFIVIINYESITLSPGFYCDIWVLGAVMLSFCLFEMLCNIAVGTVFARKLYQVDRFTVNNLSDVHFIDDEKYNYNYKYNHGGVGMKDDDSSHYSSNSHSYSSINNNKNKYKDNVNSQRLELSAISNAKSNLTVISDTNEVTMEDNAYEDIDSGGGDASNNTRYKEKKMKRLQKQKRKMTKYKQLMMKLVTLLFGQIFVDLISLMLLAMSYSFFAASMDLLFSNLCLWVAFKFNDKYYHSYCKLCKLCMYFFTCGKWDQFNYGANQ